MTAETSVLLVDKPAGVTSHDIVRGVRRQLPKGTKVGHAGTLDPFATGLLIVLVGKATRTQTRFMGLDKEYVATARFGAVSDTLDRDGRITVTGRLPTGPLALPTGDLMQTPPRFSAIHVRGERAHRLARAGEEFEMEQRGVRVDLFEQIGAEGDLRIFRIRCGSGTYVRSLVADLGDAYCESLRRTAIGPFHLPAEADADAEPTSLPLGDALRMVLPAVELNAAAAQDLAHGRRPQAPPGCEPEVVVFGPDGLVAIASLREDGTLAASVGLAG